MELPRDSDGRLSEYAWPGGYPIYYYDKEHNVLCPKCARKSDEDPEEIPQFKVIGSGINYEDDNCWCQQCNQKIEVAYADNETKEAL